MTNFEKKTITPLSNPVAVADLHLSEATPRTLLGFIRFLEQIAPRYPELLILGDLFNEWTGDEMMRNDVVATVAAHLQVLACSGRRVCIMPGDRDFLIGGAFLEAAGAELLPDPWATEIHGLPIIFSHGDRWCAKEEAHLYWRRFTDDPAWRSEVMRAPENLRNSLIQEARVKALEATHSIISPAHEMRINEYVANKACREAGCEVIVHAHVMHPGANVTSTFDRWVMPYWDLDGDEQKRSGYMTFMKSGRPQIQMM